MLLDIHKTVNHKKAEPESFDDFRFHTYCIQTYLFSPMEQDDNNYLPSTSRREFNSNDLRNKVKNLLWHTHFYKMLIQLPLNLYDVDISALGH